MNSSQSPPSWASGRSVEDLRRAFLDEGYVMLPGVLDPDPLAELGTKLSDEFDRVKESGRLFTGGGLVSGHLNCFPGSASRFVHDVLAERGVFDVVRFFSEAPLRNPNVGCNFNLPGSNEQNEHVDGDPDRPFLVLNVAVVKTDLVNGSMEVLGRTHRKRHKFWELMLSEPERTRLCMEPGDVVIRTSNLWHRGMANKGPVARPMLAFTWEGGGTDDIDPYSLYGGRVTFLPNRYHVDWKSRLRERAFVAAPRLGRTFLAVRSLFGDS
jgi:hypothetical protein